MIVTSWRNDVGPDIIRRRRMAKKAQDRVLLRTYGITTAQRDALLKRQGEKCAICGTAAPGKWCVDHCHTTRRIRGVLCKHCNWLLGHARDNPKTLRAAARYLDNSVVNRDN